MRSAAMCRVLRSRRRARQLDCGSSRGALAAFVDVDHVPVPRARPYLSAREAFIYLVLFGTLYTSAFYLGSLIFDIINLTFPDRPRSRRTTPPISARRCDGPSLIVAFPVFLYSSTSAR